MHYGMRTRPAAEGRRPYRLALWCAPHLRRAAGNNCIVRRCQHRTDPRRALFFVRRTAPSSGARHNRLAGTDGLCALVANDVRLSRRLFELIAHMSLRSTTEA